MKQTKKLLVVATIASAMLFSSCEKENNEPIKQYSTEVIANPAVKAKLAEQGLTLDKAGKLLLDDKAKTITSLDFSGTKITDFSVLKLFPKVEEVKLADNDYKMSFDFAQLPKQITKVDLSDNELYEFVGLAKLDDKTKETIILKELKSLVLPATAKNNVETLPFYFKKMGEKITMTMQNKDGKAEPYTTLREVPDPEVRALLKETFPTKFVGEKLDLFKRFGESRSNDLNVSTFTFWGEIPLKNKKLTSLEGVQYIVADPEWRGAFTANLFNQEEYLVIPYLKVNANCSKINTVKVNTPLLNLSSATNLISCIIGNNKALKSLDLSMTRIGKIGLGGGSMFSGCMVMLNSCPELEEIKLPNLDKVKEPTLANCALLALPKLKGINLEQFQWVRQIDLVALPSLTTLVYPDFKYSRNENGNKLELGGKEQAIFHFSIDKEIYDKAQTPVFINKIKNDVKLSSKEEISTMIGPLGFVDYNGQDHFELYDYTKTLKE